MNTAYEHVVDGLATEGYAVIDDFLSPAQVDGILGLDEFREGLLQFRKAGIGSGQDKQINESIRGDYVKWIDFSTTTPELRTYWNTVSEMMGVINRALFLSLKDFEAHLTKYPAGSYYNRHLDQFTRDDHRRLSVITYLNLGWQESEGGQLRLHLTSGPKDVLPVAGRMVCFRSDSVEHEVMVATRDRLSITGWVLDQFAELKHLG